MFEVIRLPNIEIKSDGTVAGTKIFIDGIEQTNLENIIFSADFESVFFNCIVYRSTDDKKRAIREVIFR